jgi:hypothetical protein
MLNDNCVDVMRFGKLEARLKVAQEIDCDGSPRGFISLDALLMEWLIRKSFEGRKIAVRCYFGFGGGGLGTPVVSYAPLPMLHDGASLVIILKCVRSAAVDCVAQGCLLDRSGENSKTVLLVSQVLQATFSMRHRNF